MDCCSCTALIQDTVFFLKSLNDESASMQLIPTPGANCQLQWPFLLHYSTLFTIRSGECTLYLTCLAADYVYPLPLIFLKEVL